MVDLDDPGVWTQCPHKRGEFFKQTMSMVMKNLPIVQHCDILRYAHIRGGAYQPRLRMISKGHYVYW